MTEELEVGEVVWLKSGAMSRQADYKEGSIGTPKMTIEVISGVGSEKKASCIWWDGSDYNRHDFYVVSLTKVNNETRM